MIPLKPVSWQGESWQWHLANAVDEPAALASALGIEVDPLDTGFPLRVPLPYLARIEPGNPDDPLLRQVLPVAEELVPADGWIADPLAERNLEAPAGLLHKYAGRALLVMTGACAINCRYCFRRHFPYADRQLDGPAWAGALDYLSSDQTLREVILSGGDPLAANDRRLASLSEALDAIDHLTTLRIHTRLPVVIPQRVCDALLDWLQATRLRTVIVIHANHPNELDGDVRDALQRLAGTGATLLNQSVLLAGVNDSAEVLIELSERLFDMGVLPYYLHRLDRVQGARHFDPGASAPRQLLQTMRNALPGYLVPRFVAEIPGEGAKRVLL